MAILRADSRGIAHAADLLMRGEIVAYPTETRYGLAVRGDDAEALARLSLLKERPNDQAIALIVADWGMIETLIDPATWTVRGRALAERHWPGPLTIVLPARPGVPVQLLGPTGGVGVRISSDPIASALVRYLGIPLTATSANLRGDPPATNARDALISGVEWVLDGGRRGGDPSTIVAVEGSSLRILRAGVIHL